MTKQKPKVFYDGGCPVCSREISLYKNSTGSQNLDWIDVSGVKPDLPENLSQEAAMGRFHVQSGNGELYDGAAAFSHMWLNLPKFRWLGRMTSLPGITSILELGYRGFLKVRPLFRKKA